MTSANATTEFNENKVCLVTGANSGIGRETALGLARAGATVILVCRDRSKGEVALSEIKRASANKSVVLLTADLTQAADIQTLQSDVKDKFGHVNVLINNAGAIFGARNTTEEGIELTFATNHLNYFMMSHAFMKLLQTGAKESGVKSRIINVASEAHRQVNSETLDWQCENTEFKPMSVYGLSKLANILFTRELAQRLNPAECTVNCLHPGVVRTGFGANNDWGLLGFLFNAARPFFLSPEQGAKTSLYLATHDSPAECHGSYFKNCKEVRPSQFAFNEKMSKNLWETSVRLTGMGH